MYFRMIIPTLYNIIKTYLIIGIFPKDRKSAIDTVQIIISSYLHII